MVALTGARGERRGSGARQRVVLLTHWGAGNLSGRRQMAHKKKDTDIKQEQDGPRRALTSRANQISNLVFCQDTQRLLNNLN